MWLMPFGCHFRSSIILLILLLIAILQSLLTAVTCFKEQILTQTKFNGLIAAFGDFDSDRFTDVFLISDGGKSLQLLKSNEKEPELRAWPHPVSCAFDQTDDIIAAIIPGDFNGDAMMDVLAVTQEGKDKRNRFNIWIFKGDRHSLDCNNTKTPLIKNVKSQPLIFDYNGDMIADFIVETEKCSRQLWTYSNKQFIKECPANLQLPSGHPPMRFPNSNAFVNLQNCNGAIDFNADIFISGEKDMEYWFNDGGFRNDNFKTIHYPDKHKYLYGQSTFSDLNIDGCIEHYMPVCEKQSGSVCDPQILLYDNITNDWIQISNFNDNGNQTNFQFEELTTAYGFDLPITVRPGDIDGDGYVDLITVMRNRKDGKTRAVVLRNTKDDLSPLGRKFTLFWTSDSQIDGNIELASFLDLQENGKLDLIMSVRDTASSQQYNVIWVRNTFMESNCFLKVLVTTGLCFSTCPNDKVPYGTNLAGPFVCYETSNIDGHLIKGCATQMPQSAHFALQMPYSVFGLGEAPNFVESVTTSIPSGEIKPLRRSRWTQIVPDAQIVLVPYPPNETAYWTCKLFYTPSSIVYSTLATLGVMCSVLIIIILILHRKEVMKDISEHEEYKRYWPESR